jgi:hypothetical protein
LTQYHNKFSADLPITVKIHHHRQNVSLSDTPANRIPLHHHAVVGRGIFQPFFYGSTCVRIT